MPQTGIPGFFIVGAPRCGTTAMSTYLSGHPEVCFSVPKENHFFALHEKSSVQSQGTLSLGVTFNHLL